MAQLTGVLDDLVHLSPGAMAALRLDAAGWRFSLCNPAFEQLCGRAHLAGKTIAEAFPDLLRLNPRLAARLRRASRDGHEFLVEGHPISLDWAADHVVVRRYINLAIVPRRDERGSVCTLLAFAYDTTSQVQSHQAAARAEAHQRRAEHVMDVLENMNDAFFAVDAQWTLVRVNHHHERISQIPRAEQLGKSFLNLFLYTPEHQRTRYWSAYHKVMRERVSVAFEEYYATLNLWTSIDAYPTAGGGMAVFYRDITAQKTASQRVEAERQKFEAIFVESPACMALLRGPHLVFEKVNPKFKALMGNRDLVDKSLHDALPELVGQPFYDLMQRVFATGEAFDGHEMVARLVRTVGEEPEAAYFDFTNSRVEDGLGQPYGVYVHAIDVTDKVMARRRVENLAADLQQAVRARDTFLSIASHELKTPITSLKLQLEMTRRKIDPGHERAPSPSKLARVLDVAGQQVQRLMALIDDLLDISRIETGKMAYRFSIVDLAEIVHDVVERLAEQATAAGCSLDACTEPGVSIWGDRFRLEQALTNLINNAIKYGAGHPIHVAAHGASIGGAIDVVDHGMGIAPDMQEKVFNRFERAVSHLHISGLGLGLYITKQIIEAHGGRILLESEVDRGSTFTLEVPRAPDTQASAPSLRH